MYDETQQSNDEAGRQPFGQPAEQPEGSGYELPAFGRPVEQPSPQAGPATTGYGWPLEQPAQPTFQAPVYGRPVDPAATAQAGPLRRRVGGLAAATALGVTAYVATAALLAPGGAAVVASSPGLSSSSGSLPSSSDGTRMFWRGGMTQGYPGNGSTVSGSGSGLGLGLGLLSGVGSGSRFNSGSTTTQPTAAQTTAGAAASKKVASDVVDVVARLSNGIGAGTGIVLSSDGLILTNNHVVDGAEAIQATDIGNGKTYRAELVGRDPQNDIAVLQLVGASGLPVAPIASSAAKVGDTVIGVGNGLGRGGAPSWAVGTVTGLNRSITATDEGGSSPERVSGMIQSTAGILPGDSGGPLVNTAGQVVGMDTAGEFASRNPEAPAQASFAIPISTALEIARQLQNGTDPNGTTSLSDGPSILGLPL